MAVIWNAYAISLSTSMTALATSSSVSDSLARQLANPIQRANFIQSSVFEGDVIAAQSLGIINSLAHWLSLPVHFPCRICFQVIGLLKLVPGWVHSSMLTRNEVLDSTIKESR